MEDLDHMMIRLGRLVALDRDLEVVVRGTHAFAEPGKITLPAIEKFDVLGQEQAERLMHGLIDHECGHALDTDFTLFSKAHEQHPSFHDLLNAIEDGYIEHRQCLRYPGSSYNLGLKNAWFWDTDLPGCRSAAARIANPEGEVWEQFLLGLTFIVRPGGKSLEEVEACNSAVGTMLRKVQPLLLPIEGLSALDKQTAACLKIAEQIWAIYKDDREPSPSPAPITVLTPEGALACLIDVSMLQTEMSDGPYVVFDPSFDLERDFSTELTAKLTAAYGQYRLDTERVATELVSTFEAQLRDRQLKRLTFSSESECGEIDGASLAAFSLGAAEPEDLWLAHEAEEEGGHATVAVLIDCSGSMQNGPGTKSDLARQCAIAVHEALRLCHIPHEICGFTTIHSDLVPQHPWSTSRELEYAEHFRRLRQVCREAHARGVDLSKFARTCNGDPNTQSLQVPIYGVFKGFDLDESRGLALIAGISANLDGEAIVWQARRLAQRSERRKVLFVLSDGFPAGANDDAAGARYLHQSVRRALAAGIEVYGIGIMSRAVERFYPYWWVCDELAELPSVVMRALAETMATQEMPVWEDHRP